MRKVERVLMGMACVAAAAGCARSPKLPPPPPPSVVSTTTEGQGSLVQRNMVTATAVVTRIDQDRRLVTLRGPNGKTQTIKVGDEVKNLPQVRRGDHVVVRYYESLALELKKPGRLEPARAVVGAGIAAPGQMPAGASVETVTVTARIIKIDRANQTVTLKGPKGKVVTVDVDDPKRLERLRPGDRVQATYTEALAISVEQAAAGR